MKDKNESETYDVNTGFNAVVKEIQMLQSNIFEVIDELQRFHYLRLKEQMVSIKKDTNSKDHQEYDEKIELKLLKEEILALKAILLDQQTEKNLNVEDSPQVTSNPNLHQDQQPSIFKLLQSMQEPTSQIQNSQKKSSLPPVPHSSWQSINQQSKAEFLKQKKQSHLSMNPLPHTIKSRNLPNLSTELKENVSSHMDPSQNVSLDKTKEINQPNINQTKKEEDPLQAKESHNEQQSSSSNSSIKPSSILSIFKNKQ